MSFKKFNQFITEGDMSTSTNRVSQETSLKQAYPDAEDSEDQDKYNPSIINKVAIKNNDVSFIGKKKTKGKSIDTFSNRNKDEETEGQSTLSQSGVSEGDINDGELEVGIEVEMEHTDDRKEAEKIAKDHISEDPKYYSKLYKAGLIDEPKAMKLAKDLDEGGMGDNQVAGQRVYTQHTDKSKQGYQDSMYYGDEEVDDHGPECDCPDCTAKFD